jgi:hypothetical protein
MKNAQTPGHISLNTLLGRLREGRFAVPDFQRDFEWDPWDVRDLMRSIFLDYYIGSLLLWKGKKNNFEALSCEPLRGVPQTGAEEYIVLDGQQRLTAMNYAFHAPDDASILNRKKPAAYFIRIDEFMAEQYDRAFSYEFLSQRFRKLLTDEEAQFANHILPLSVIGRGGRGLVLWFIAYENFWKRAAEDARASGDLEEASQAKIYAEYGPHLSEFIDELINQYQVSFIELDEDLEIDKVCDIFTQINSKGVQLDVFDLINALLVPKGLKLKHLWREAADRLAFVESDKMNVYILQVMSILRQEYCSPAYLYYLIPGSEKPIREADGTRRREVLVPNGEDFRSRWDIAVAAMERAIKAVRHPQEYGAISPKYLPYVSILPAFSALLEAAKRLPSERQLSAQRKVRHWYWASVFTARYSGSVESTSARDFREVCAWLEDDNLEPGLIAEFKSRFKQLDLRNEQKRGSSIYNGIFNLFIISGARDWVSGAVTDHEDLDDHHIVPASWGAKNLGDKTIHSILNRSPLSSSTNRAVISDKLPNQYLPEWIERNGEKEVRATLETHLISPAAFDILLRAPFTPADYEEFITERQKTIRDAVENLLIKQRLDLPSNLRELDEKIESVELGMRDLIAASLEGTVENLPSHVRQKAGERISRAARKDPAFDADRYETIDGLLEFFDLRELQDTMTSKACWPAFQGAFLNKDALVTKFGQLAELRNCIAHSRSVDTITQREGEAAIEWFERVLGRRNSGLKQG